MKVSGSGLDAAASNIIGKVLKLIFGLIMIAVVLVVGFGIYFFFELNQKPSSDDSPSPFTVEKGDSISTISDRLYQDNFIRNTFVFRVRAKMLKAEDKVQAGTVTLRHDMKMDEVLEAITSARLNDRTVLIKEGLRLEQIAQIYADAGWDKTKFIKAVREETWDFRFLADKPAQASVEGYLFPDTYRIPANYTESQIVEMMLRRFADQYNETLRNEATNSNGSLFKTVTMASLVEREAVKDDERPKIASVFYNRLKADMMLQTDPTVQYARDTIKYSQSNNLAEWWLPPTKEDLNVESPYNTYKNKGLPPGPICNAGLASLKAATEPAATDYLYFVATGDRDGSHAFAKTLDEHNQNVRKYQGNK